MPSNQEQSLVADWWKTIDRGLLALIVLLALCGVITALVATPQAALHYKLEPFYFAKRQAAAIALGLVVMVAVSFASPSTIRRLALVLFASGIALMIAALFQGAERNGAVRWLYIGGAVLQPSEFTKPGFIVLSAWLFSESVRRPDMPALEAALALLLIFAGLLVLQPDMGQAIIATGVWCGLFFLCGYPFRFLPIIGGLCTGGLFIAYEAMPHFAKRIDRFFGHLADAQQGVVANAAFRDAGWLGHGLGEGFTKQRLPDAHNDYVFAAVAEELGIAACLFLILIYGLIVWKVRKKAAVEADLFLMLAATGLIMVFGFQALINMAVNVSLMPAKGVTLPFLSYGRSSVLSSAITLGMIVALTRKRFAQALPANGVGYGSNSGETWVVIRSGLRRRSRTWFAAPGEVR